MRTRRPTPRAWRAAACGLLAAAAAAPAQDVPPPTARAPITDIRREALTPDLIPPVPRQPFRWGRRPEYHRRVGRSACGLPAADYDRTIPRLVARAVSFRTPGPEAVAVPEAARLLVAGGRPAAGGPFKVPPRPGADPPAMALAGGGRPASTAQLKRFVLTERRVVAGPFALERVGVQVYDDGRVLATADLFHTGGVEASERGGAATVTVRGLAAGPGLDADPTGPGTAALWSASEALWAPRGGPTPVEIRLDALDDPYLRARVAAGFAEATHVEVTLEPREIR